MARKEYILSQYANSPKMLTLIKGFEELLATENDINNFYEKIFNIETANTMGLNIWGQILNIPRYLNVEVPGGEDLYELPNDLYRLLLLIRAMSNVSTCTVPNLQNILNVLFADRGTVRVFDTGIMTMKYVFEFYLTPEERAILNLPGIPPKPTGVGLTILELPPDKLFGFKDTGFQPWNQAPFRNL